MRQVITGMDGGSLAVWDTTNGKLKRMITTQTRHIIQNATQLRTPNAQPNTH